MQLDMTEGQQTCAWESIEHSDMNGMRPLKKKRKTKPQHSPIWQRNTSSHTNVPSCNKWHITTEIGVDFTATILMHNHNSLCSNTSSPVLPILYRKRELGPVTFQKTHDIT